MTKQDLFFLDQNVPILSNNENHFVGFKIAMFYDLPGVINMKKVR